MARDSIGGLAVDIGAAGAASMAVSPFILTIDRAIVENAAGRTSLLRGIFSGVKDILMRPNRALLCNPAYWMVTGVYGVTYAAANLIDSASKRMAASPAVHGTSKLLGTTAVNTSACIAKDVAFTRMFGAASAAGKPMPLATIGLFGLRDVRSWMVIDHYPPHLPPTTSAIRHLAPLPRAVVPLQSLPPFV